MLPEKIRITPSLRLYIVSERKKQNISAYTLSEMCGKNKTWLPNIEISRTKTILKEDIISIVVALTKKSQKQAENIIEGILEYTDDEYQYKLDEYEFELKRQEYERKINEAHKKMLSLLDKVDFSNEDSILKYEKILMTYTGLFTTDNGNECVKKLFQYPLHKLSEEELNRAESFFEKEMIRKYALDQYTTIGKPLLRIFSEGEELFS